MAFTLYRPDENVFLHPIASQSNCELKIRRSLMKIIQHCRPKPNPSGTFVPVRHDPAQGDVRHQGVEEETLVNAPVQGGGRAHVQEEYAPQQATGDVIDFLNFSEIYEQPQELRVGSSVVNILNSRTFFMKKLNPSARRGCTKNIVNTYYLFVFFR